MLGFDSYKNLFMINIFWVATGVKEIFYGVDQILPKIPFRINIAFDQSSTQTGIAIMDDEKGLLAVMDVCNIGLPDSDTYIRMIRKWIANNFEHQDVHYVICERAEQNAKQIYVKKVLQKLISVLEDFAFNVNAPCYQIDNKVWKKYYLKDDKFKGRRQKTEFVKVAVKERSVDLYPSLDRYYQFMSSTDSADALGIMYGFLEEFFTNGFDSNKRICTIMPMFPKRSYKLQFLTVSEFRELVKNNPANFKHVEVVKYNDDYTLEDNARRVINFFKNGAVLYTRDEKTLRLWKFTADKEIDKNYCLYVTHK